MCINKINNWSDEELRGWSDEELRGWSDEELRGWSDEELNEAKKEWDEALNNLPKIKEY